MIWRCILLVFALSLGIAPAYAGSVYVTTETEEFGHAWLFGSRSSVSEHCWLVMPRHVVEAFGGGGLLPVRFRGRTGDWGESDVPVAVSDIAGAAEAAGDADLVFAEVLVGPQPGQCLDRLGLPPIAYEAALDRHDAMFVRSMLPQSFGDFDVDVQAGATGDKAGILRIAPANPADGPTYLKRGLSGAVTSITRPTGAEPLAMILRVEEDQKTALSLRFDRIRSAFDLVEAAVLAKRRQAVAESTGVPYRILSFAGISAGPGPATELAGDAGCWRVAPEGGKRTISVVIEFKDKLTVVRGLTVAQSAGCGTAPADVFIDQRVSEKNDWSRTAQCSSGVEAGPEPACHLDLRGPRQLRIGITARGEIGISALRLY